MNRQIQLFGITIDVLTMDAAVNQLFDWVRDGSRQCRYVVTPNVDHVVQYQENAALKQAYATADMVLADGTPVVMAARLLGRKLPERVAGADLVPALFAAWKNRDRRLRVYLLGAAEGVGQTAAQRIVSNWPDVEVVGTYSPPIGFEHDENENQQILARISQASPDVLVVGLGAPKQELWVAAHQEAIDAPVALCVGATIDFLAGHKPRAPHWMRRCGLEWLHRVASEPRRLAKRYLRDASIFPRLVWQQWRQRPI